MDMNGKELIKLLKSTGWKGDNYDESICCIDS